MRDICGIDSVSPLQGFRLTGDIIPGALPQATLFCPTGAEIRCGIRSGCLSYQASSKLFFTATDIQTFTPKGYYRVAQGNALGREQSQDLKALKGRNKNVGQDPCLQQASLRS